MGTPTFVILIVCFASFAVADDFRTTKGKEYKNATVSRVEPDGIVIKFKGGIVKILFTELPKDVQLRFGYDTDKIEAEQEKRIDQEKAAERERAEREKNRETDCFAQCFTESFRFTKAIITLVPTQHRDGNQRFVVRAG